MKISAEALVKTGFIYSFSMLAQLLLLIVIGTRSLGVDTTGEKMVATGVVLTLMGCLGYYSWRAYRKILFSPAK